MVDSLCALLGASVEAFTFWPNADPSFSTFNNDFDIELEETAALSEDMVAVGPGVLCALLCALLTF